MRWPIVMIFGFALLGVVPGARRRFVGAAAVFGLAALYLMINPAKASYSVAPTMVLCALAGWLTAKIVRGWCRGIGLS